MTVHIGISGYDYPGWRGDFYPTGIPRRAWLGYAASRFDAIELNGTFYSLKWPALFQRWSGETPDRFTFAVKGGRFLTHNLKLRHCEGPLANFLASGVLLLGKKLGPLLWQLPDSYGFDAQRMGDFLSLLPHTHAEAARRAKQHDHRLSRGAWTEAVVKRPLRHVFEVRHTSYFQPAFYALLREHDCGLVIADTAGKFPMASTVTSDLVYVRLHGSTQLYVSGYSPRELAAWAKRIRGWDQAGREVHVYFDNDARGHAPHNALALAALLQRGAGRS